MKSLILIMSLLSSAALAQAADATRYVYLRCNGTTWDVTEANRFKTGPAANRLTLTVDVKDVLNDECVLTETDALNAWGNTYSAFVLYQKNLSVGDSTNLYNVSSADEGTAFFKVKYSTPGRYLFTLDSNIRSLSIDDPAKIVQIPARAASSEVLGSVSEDAFGRIFLTGFVNGSSFSRLDPATGKPLWVIQEDNQYASYNTQCIDQNNAYVISNGKVKALAIDTGSPVWEKDLNGGGVPDNAYLSCFKGSSTMLLSYFADGNTVQKFTAIEQSSGKFLWTYESAVSTSISGADKEHALFSQYVDGMTSSFVLRLKDGRQLWKKDSGSEWLTFDGQNRLFMQGSKSIKYLDVKTGGTIWSYERADSEYLYLPVNTLSNVVFIQHSNGFSSLDAKTGKLLWFEGIAAGESQSTLLLPNGRVLLYVTDYETGVIRMRMLEGTTGLELWKRTDKNVYPLADNGNRVYLQGKSRLSLLNGKGRSAWTFFSSKPDNLDVSFGQLVRKSGKLYITYASNVGHKYPPSGLISVNSENGKPNWMFSAPSTTSLVSIAGNFVYMSNIFSSSTSLIAK